MLFQLLKNRGSTSTFPSELYYWERCSSALRHPPRAPAWPPTPWSPPKGTPLPENAAFITCVGRQPSNHGSGIHALNKSSPHASQGRKKSAGWRKDTPLRTCEAWPQGPGWLQPTSHRRSFGPPQQTRRHLPWPCPARPPPSQAPKRTRGFTRQRRISSHALEVLSESLAVLGWVGSSDRLLLSFSESRPWQRLTKVLHQLYALVRRGYFPFWIMSVMRFLNYNLLKLRSAQPGLCHGTGTEQAPTPARNCPEKSMASRWPRATEGRVCSSVPRQIQNHSTQANNWGSARVTSSGTPSASPARRLRDGPRSFTASRNRSLLSPTQQGAQWQEALLTGRLKSLKIKHHGADVPTGM